MKTPQVNAPKHPDKGKPAAMSKLRYVDLFCGCGGLSLDVVEAACAL